LSLVVLTDYGHKGILWVDFSCGPWEDAAPPGRRAADWDSFRLGAMIEEVQPGIRINNRMGTPGEMEGGFLTPE
jgi:alpha-L-fucosidase